MAVDEKRVLTIPMVSPTGCDLPGDRTVDIRVEPYGVLRIGSTDTGSIFPVRLADLAEIIRRLTGGPTDATTDPPPTMIAELRRLLVALSVVRGPHDDDRASLAAHGIYAIDRNDPSIITEALTDDK